MNTDKIFRALLEVNFPGKSDILLEIANATPNPDVAVEILCDLYEDPEIPQEPASVKSFSKSQKQIIFNSFNKFKREITYSFYRVECDEVWVAKGAGIPEYGSYDKKLTHWNSKEVATFLDITEEELRDLYTRVTVYGPISETISTSTCSLNDWLRK